MRRRKFLIGTGSVAAGSAAALGSSAFRQSTAQRGFQLTIARDNEAPYLNLKPGSGPYAEYADGALTVNFGNNSQGGTGIPSRANTWFEDVFTIQNLGEDDVFVWAPSFPAGTNPRNRAGAASTNFLVKKNGTGYKYGTGGVSVDYIDISWPNQIGPADKPSNPVPQVGSSSSGAGQVDTSYKGVRYPGGIVALPSGNEVDVDIRFTVSNIRQAGDNLDEEFDASFFVRSDKASPNSADAWEL